MGSILSIPRKRGHLVPRDFQKKRIFFFQLTHITRALTRAQVRRPQSVRVKVRSHLPASRKKKIFFLKIPRDQGGPGSPGSIVLLRRKWGHPVSRDFQKKKLIHAESLEIHRPQTTPFFGLVQYPPPECAIFCCIGDQTPPPHRCWQVRKGLEVPCHARDPKMSIL